MTTLIRPAVRFGAALFICFLIVIVGDQIVYAGPPVQNNVVAIGLSPLVATATASFVPGSAFTMEAWIYPTKNQPNGWIMGKCLDALGDPYLSFALLMNGDGATVNFVQTTGAPGSYTSVDSASPLPINQWTHLAATLGSGTLKLYVNGQLSASGPSKGLPLAALTVPFSVGEGFRSDGSVNYVAFSGYAQDLSYWSVARSQAQITADMGQSTPTSTTGLVAYWPLNDNPGATAQDISGNGFNLTVAGGGALTSVPETIVNSGPYYQTTTTSVANAIPHLNDGVLFDFDGDGYPDLVIKQSFSPATVPGTPTALRAFHNNHNNTFTDVTSSVLGNVTMIDPRANYVADFTGDGLKDLLVVGTGTDTSPYPGEQSRLLIQTPNGQLLDQTAARLPQHSSYTHSVAVGDIEHKGSLDIYMGNIYGGDVGPEFYINNGSGFFSEDATRIPTDIANRVTKFTSSLLLDVTGNGYPDLVLGGEGDISSPNTILINNGNGFFVRDSRFVLPPKYAAESWNTVAIATADFDGDGWPDLILSSNNNYNGTGLQLLLNNRDGTFRDATSQLGVVWKATDRWVVWTRIVDLNGDGLPDIVAVVNTSSGTYARILLNVGGAQFVDVTDAYPLGATSVLQAGDLNLDGLVELVTATSSQIQVADPVNRLTGAPFQPVPIAPTVSLPPASATVTLNGRAIFSVAGQAYPAPSFQWLQNGAPINGATSSVLTVTNAQASSAGQYSVVLSNAAGSVTSSPATLTVSGAAPVVFATQPVSQIVASGSTAVLNAVATGATGISYQWYRNGVALYGSAASRLVLSGATSVVAGSYTCVASTTTGTATSNTATLAVTTTTNPGRLLNLSVNTTAGKGQVLTVGFVTGGAGTAGSQTLLIRATGPALAALGVSNVLPDPTLTVLKGQNVVASNDNWGTPASNQAAVTAADSATGAFALTNSASLDAATVVSLAAATGYTVQISGNTAAIGTTLAEVYDDTPAGTYTPATPRLINISANNLIAANASMTAGFVVGGTTSKTILIRADGPALAAFGVSGAMPDPQIALHTTVNGQDTVLASNAGWGGDPAIMAVDTAVGAFALTNPASKDSVVLISLPPGAYTAVASSVTGTAGVAVIEVYEVP